MTDENITTVPQPETVDTPVEVVDIQFRPGQKVYFFDPDGNTYLTLQRALQEKLSTRECNVLRESQCSVCTQLILFHERACAVGLRNFANHAIQARTRRE